MALRESKCVINLGLVKVSLNRGAPWSYFEIFNMLAVIIGTFLCCDILYLILSVRLILYHNKPTMFRALLLVLQDMYG